MKGLENHTYLLAFIISNALAIVLLVLAWKRPKIARVLFVVLFAWACWINWRTALNTPQAYLEYADLTFLNFYSQFICGWFSRHILLVIGLIATCQGLIAVALSLKGWIYRMGLAGGILFFISIAPLGVGSAFPCTLIAAVTLVLLWKKNEFLWQYTRREYTVAVDQ